MRIGLLGGSFDPFHLGHEALIEGALRSGKADLIIVIPSGRNPFKKDNVVSAAPYRYYMTLNAVENDFRGMNVFVSDIEFRYSGPSYTLTTIKEISRPQYIRAFLKASGIKESAAGEHHVYYWITGSDVLPDFDKWHNAGEILNLAGLLVAGRKGDGVDTEAQVSRLKDMFGNRADIQTFDIDGVDISSTMIRSGGRFDLTPDAVRGFISAHALYGSDNPLAYVSAGARDAFYENSIRLYGYLGQKRLLHTLNVGLLSARYASVYDKSLTDKALIAGQLHDCAKELDIDLQREMAESYTGDVFTGNKLLHSPAGAVLARDEFGVDDPDILDAITYHTTGRGGMSLLERIVYLADKLEPSRTYADLETERELAYRDIDAALRLCVGSMKKKFESGGQAVHPLTFDFMRDLGL